ncbi:MAG TPA: flavin-dependent oxidoreductase [Afifellaceae bacterium]|nr:flavin-dependent oxidoreductase [Afifellaceae bacterium]
MRVLIAGGGIGGLTAALALHRKGIEAEVFEQSRGKAELGVGINTLPHAIKELADLGLLEALDGIAIRTRELIYKNSHGQEILRQLRGLDAGYDYPQFSIHRGKLQRVIREHAVAELGAERIRSGQRLTRFLQNGDGVRATFLDRQTGDEYDVEGDVLVGADGIHSTVRAHYHPGEGPPSWNGVVMWRGATLWEPFLTGRSMVIAGGMSAKLVLYPIFNDPENHPGRTLMNWVVCAKVGDSSSPLPVREDWSKPAALEDVLPHARAFTVTEVDLEALIRATPEFYVYPMCDRDPLERWSDGRVTLLGDAAHPMYPVGSNGASQAILDARTLADRLSDHADPVEALAAYDAERRTATAAIVLANRGGGPEGVIDLVEERAPDGFADIGDVATPDELKALVGDYQQMAGFATEQVNRAG